MTDPITQAATNVVETMGALDAAFASFDASDESSAKFHAAYTSALTAVKALEDSVVALGAGASPVHVEIAREARDAIKARFHAVRAAWEQRGSAN